MLCWIKPTVIGLITFVVLLVFGVSCADPIQQHRILTFFFDGVPPLETQRTESEEVSVETKSRSPGEEQEQEEPEKIWYVHEPRKNCATCHGQRRQRGFSGRPRLTAPVPELCYTCHDDYTKSATVVHGPVAVGQCLFCHNPHKTKVEHLLKDTVPELCYLCHDQQVILSISNHLPELLPKCNDCHDVHANSAKSLLKNATVMKGHLKTAEVLE